MPADDLALLAQAARAAGTIARRHFGNGPATWDKGDGQGPVTEADLEIDAMLRRDLLAARPEYGWLSEETTDGPARLNRSKVFVVDPIDGTRAFLEGSKDFSHSLAVVEDGIPVAAAIYLPVRDRLYLASRGGGATCDGRAIGPSGRTDLTGATVLGSRPNFTPARWKGGSPPVERCFRSSLAYRLALVAEGRFDAMLALRPAWEWDIAAGALIVAEAGGQIHDRRGCPLRFNAAMPQHDGVVAGTPAIAGALLARLV
ncbi:3'(2'),5'-bisphosphate nucleotidase CysQ [Jannaschia sp. S6380]|uniref:3'(2'),5'-bisphosphate nucleotidase CysQ n=1 Tax=Jannaschia sp. S6380 TaxID=2926408 RepID=UPI001FF365CC|nr:3'(2'),5'-bisphosphate nucleotidase CysQ [Jannaschia sp. S6380]MCK0168719.1 3'(2'),5'-bisphosphate nucleotidase CysQ [Jannaschia sp. S6380]